MSAGAVTWSVDSLREELEDSPAIGWMKDSTGRFVSVNRRYVDELGVGEDRVLGRTDEELAPRETVDGPRRRADHERFETSEQLEYTVPEFEGRGALSAVRFVVRDGAGESIGVCGLAAPLHDAQLVRDEAARLMRAERSDRVEATELHEPVPEASGPAPGPGSESEDSDPRRRWHKRMRQLDEEAERWLAEVDQARDAIRQREELERALASERQRADELARALAQVRARIGELDRAVEQALPNGDALPAGGE